MLGASATLATNLQQTLSLQTMFDSVGFIKKEKKCIKDKLSKSYKKINI